jgi:hypothetical protein
MGYHFRSSTAMIKFEARASRRGGPVDPLGAYPQRDSDLRVSTTPGSCRSGRQYFTGNSMRSCNDGSNEPAGVYSYTNSNIPCLTASAAVHGGSEPTPPSPWTLVSGLMIRDDSEAVKFQRLRIDVGQE